MTSAPLRLSRKATHSARLLVALLAAFGILLVAQQPAQAAQLRGVAMHVQANQTDYDPSLREQEFQMLQNAGATSIRFDIMWQTVEWNEGEIDPNVTASLDTVFQQARAHGLKVILDLWATPCWASSAPLTVTQGCGYGWWERPVDTYPPVNPQAYASIATFAVKRWGDDLAALEVWNEPNTNYFFTAPDHAAAYAQLVKTTYAAVKAVAPKLPVIMNMAGTDIPFLSELYADGVKGSYDGIAVHPYYQLQLTGLHAFRAYQLSQGDHTPLWVTEVGWPSNEVGLQGQGTDIASVLRQLAALPYVAAAEVYDMRDGGTDPSDPEDHFGLFDYSMTPKPAWYAFSSTLKLLAAKHAPDTLPGHRRGHTCPPRARIACAARPAVMDGGPAGVYTPRGR